MIQPARVTSTFKSLVIVGRIADTGFMAQLASRYPQATTPSTRRADMSATTYVHLRRPGTRNAYTGLVPRYRPDFAQRPGTVTSIRGIVFQSDVLSWHRRPRGRTGHWQVEHDAGASVHGRGLHRLHRARVRRAAHVRRQSAAALAGHWGWPRPGYSSSSRRSTPASRTARRFLR